MTLSGLASKWSGFEEKVYWLDSEKILDLRLTEAHAKEETPTTVGAILKRVESARVEVEDCTLETTVAIDAEKLTGLPR